MKQNASAKLLYSTGSSAQSQRGGMGRVGERLKRKGICILILIDESHSCIAETNTHCKAIIPQLKKLCIQI